MSGRQQHYLPQFLQRNFHSRKSGSEYYVHVHRKTSSFQPNTSGVGQQRDFYGNPDESQADAKITLGEQILGDVVRRLASGTGQAVTQEELAVLVASLSLRTKKMRESLKNAAPRIVSALAEALEKRITFSQEYDSFFADTKKINALIDGELAKLPRLNRNQVAVFKSSARRKISDEANNRRDESLAELKIQFSTLMERLHTEASEIAESSFLKLFETSSVPDTRVALFRELKYTVNEATEGDRYILGDCAVVALQSDGRPKLALNDIDAGLTLSEVWLPISPRLSVVGRRSSGGEMLTVEQVNRLSAMLSYDFFISDVPLSELNPELPSLIGTAEPLMTEDELAEISKFERS